MLSSKFVNKVLERIEKLDTKSLKDFIFALSQDRQFFESIFESMIEGVIVLSESHCIQYINKPAQIMLNMIETNVIEKYFFDVLPKENPIHFFQEILTKQQKLQGEEILIRQPSLRTLQVTFYPLVKEKKILGNVLTLLDISSTKEERIKLHRAESLAALTTLAAGVAHEIKNPLGSLDIHVQLLDRLSDQLDSSVKTEFKELLQVVLEEIDKLNSIVSDFLFTVRPINIKPKPVDIFDLFDSLFKLIKYELEIKAISVKIDGDHTIAKPRVDARYLKHAFSNILKNSLEACSRGDEINVYIFREAENLVISISDTGKGISEENLAKVFEPYFTTKEFGTGLGLTIVYKIIKEHNGNIQLDSIKGEGTTFTFTIPAYEQDKRLLSYVSEDDEGL